MTAHDAWALVCRLFAEGTPVFRPALPPHELAACTLLDSAIKPAAVNQQYVLCPYCNLHRWQVVADSKGGQALPMSRMRSHSPQGTILAAAMLNEEWLRQKLHMAPEINSREGIDQIDIGIWRLGDARLGPVILARSLSTLTRAPAILEGLRVKAFELRVISPKPIDQTAHPFAPDIEWLPRQERFAFYGGGISFIGFTGAASRKLNVSPLNRFTAPFANDFRSVLLPEHSHINLTETQASVFESLWSFKGELMRAERTMKRAQLSSDKPIDVFKVKSRDKGKQGADLPLIA